VDKLLGVRLTEGVLLNVNFPNCKPEEVTGVEVTSQGRLVHSMWIDERRDGRGLPYYWLRFGREPAELEVGSDIHALRQKRISVTPLQLDLTAHKLCAELSESLK
jgi:5'-nucleotidase